MNDHGKAQQLRALARNLVEFGDMTANGARALNRIADAWDPPAQELHRGDHVIFNGGMGDWDLGIVAEEPREGRRVSVLFDGFVDNHGKRYEPYSAQVGPEYLTKMADIESTRTTDRAQMQAGYEPIYAELS